ncbi:Fe-S oxidoreductase [Dispira parvispora]|uniref:S-adenosyl-L-methionine-dependent tRNA 4-demethylwyosine synthase n=1 Tax=Dispira parvispora TaxID=1520584 RepID=A0A9W8AWD2_9FUNG|nr:Fe-S oxidoreductase [Dispira parvispora]
MSCPFNASSEDAASCSTSPRGISMLANNPWVIGALSLGITSLVLYHQFRRTRQLSKPALASSGKSPVEKGNATLDTQAKSACCAGTNPVSCACAKSPATFVLPQTVLDAHYQTPLKIFYGSQTGTAKLFAESLVKTLQARGIPVKTVDIADYDTEDFFTEKAVCLFLLSTYNVENPTDWFLKWLEDVRYDFRVAKGSLGELFFSVFGLGDSAYGEEYGFAGRCTDKWLGALGARRLYPLGEGDKNADQQASFNAWVDGIAATLVDAEAYTLAASRSDERLSDSENDEEEEDEAGQGVGQDVLGSGSDGEMVDLEDMGKVAHKIQKARVERAEDEAAYTAAEKSNQKSGRRVRRRAHRAIGENDPAPRAPRAMVSPMIHQSLTKQGYKVIGSHSGVKICRWTKSALRGRGFCYKHSFYGIQSHLCMETTPSLACANKCVFCWRHHTNPVGTEWRWQMDDPEFILEGALQNHYQMIKQLKGVPGVKAERFQEAFQAKHCALSLVGEPIMYPRINDFVRLLHSRGISSFLVTNAQFPDKIAEMEPVTQLYVSVDASTKESLKKVDRPLFRDFWERFLESLVQLRHKGQRTVYRLTLVKAFNTEELSNYVELVRRGRPEFIEVKGVTYCGFSAASSLTMENVPYHNEVIHFVEQLIEQLGSDEYEIACEHAHSCSVLVAHTKFKVQGQWHTWIDYDRFQSLAAKGEPFTSLDYMAPTPDWAIFGSDHHGFDPEETRFYRKKAQKKK